MRFAFLLSIPILAVVTGLQGLAAVPRGRRRVDCRRRRDGRRLSAIAGFLAIAFLMYWVRRASFTPFVLYRVALGVYLLYLFYSPAGRLPRAAD